MLCRGRHKITSAVREQLKESTFWHEQPVLKLGEEVRGCNEAIESEEVSSKISPLPHTLPQEFEWDTLDLNSCDILSEIAEFLGQNFGMRSKENSRAHFAHFISWFLMVPDWVPDWQCGLRAARGGKLVGLICGVPLQVRVFGEVRNMAAVRVVCVHQKLRNKKMMPVLVRELTRRVNRCGTFQGVYVNDQMFHGSVAACLQWYRPLAVEKALRHTLLSANFKNVTFTLAQRLFKLPEKNPTELCLLSEDKIKQAHALLSDHLKKCDLAPILSEEEFRHWFRPRPGVVFSFVKNGGSAGQVTDFISFYEVDAATAVPKSDDSLRFKVAYLFYYVATSVPIDVLVSGALYLAKKLNFDAFCAVETMGTKEFAQKLKFLPGEYHHYHLYNWRCPLISSDRVGLVLPTLPNFFSMLSQDKYPRQMCACCTKMHELSKKNCQCH